MQLLNGYRRSIFLGVRNHAVDLISQRVRVIGVIFSEVTIYPLATARAASARLDGFQQTEHELEDVDRKSADLNVEPCSPLLPRHASATKLSGNLFL